MFSLERYAFIDEDLSATESFTKKSLCWYDMPMEPLDFEDKDHVSRKVNTWARDEATKGRMNIAKAADVTIHPLAKDLKVFKEDRVDIAVLPIQKFHFEIGYTDEVSLSLKNFVKLILYFTRLL